MEDYKIGPVDATVLLGHLAGLCAQPFWLSLIAAGLVAALWHASLRGVGVIRLAVRLFLANVVITIVGLLAFRHDGRMATDLGMVLTTAAVSAWSLRRGR